MYWGEPAFLADATGKRWHDVIHQGGQEAVEDGQFTQPASMIYCREVSNAIISSESHSAAPYKV